MLYGLSCCCFTVAELRRLDGFQARCLRKGVGVAASFVAHVPNKEVLRIAGHTKASALLIEQQVMLLGRVLRADPQSKLHTSAFMAGTQQPQTSHYIRRVGRPRREWATTVLAEAQRRAPGQDLFNLAQDPDRWKEAMAGV